MASTSSTAASPGLASRKSESVLGTMTKESMIRSLPFFQRASGDQIDGDADKFFAELAEALHLRNYQSGDIIITEGDVARTVFFIIRGQVEVVNSGGDVKLAELHAGAFFGEMAVLFETPRVATVRAITKCLLATLTAEDLRCKLLRYPMMNEIIQREANERLLKLTLEIDNHDNVKKAVEVAERYNEMRKDTTHESLKDGKFRLMRRGSEQSFDSRSTGEPSLLSRESRTSSAIFGTDNEASQDSDDDSADFESHTLPAVPAICINNDINPDTLDSDSSADEEQTGSDALDVPLSYVDKLSKRHAVRRRASVAVWSDERLTQLAQSIGSKDGTPSLLSVKVSSGLASGLKAEYSSGGMVELSNDMMLGSLPSGLIAQILSHLEFRTLYKVRRLSKSFSRLIAESEYGLAREVDLSPWHRIVDDSILTDIMRFCGRNVVALNLRNCWQVTDKGLLKVASLAPGLEICILASVWDITDTGISSLAQQTTNLRHIDVSNCRKLSDVGILAILAGAPSVVSLQISYCKNFTDAALNHTSWCSLRSVNMQRCTGIGDGGFLEWERMTRPFHLRELILSDCSFLTDAAIASLAKVCPLLEILSLSFCCALTEAFVGPLVTSCPLIKFLDLSFCGSAVTDDCIQLLVVGLFSLERLSIRGCVQVTKYGLELLKKAQKLRVLNLSQCRGIEITPTAALSVGWTLVTTGALFQESEQWSWDRRNSSKKRINSHERAVTA